MHVRAPTSLFVHDRTCTGVPSVVHKSPLPRIRITRGIPRPQGRHKRNQPNAGLILFWPLSGLVIYSGGFLARGVAWVFIHLFTTADATGQQASTQGRAVGSEFSEFA